MEYYLAVDLGATKTRIALCTREGIVEKETYSTPRQGNELTIANSILETVRAKWHDLLRRVVAVSVASIGPLDITEGKVTYTPNIPVHTFELLKPLVKGLRKPVYVINDCVAAAWGERLYGDARNADNFVYLTLSTGVGAGVVVDGHLLMGKMGNAHEVGHIVVDFDSELRCGCGGLGHWETYAGAANLPRVAKYIAEKEHVDSELARIVLSGAVIVAKDVFDYYRRGDALARRVIELYVKATAAGIASMINAYDPELVIIGGSVFLNNIDVLYEPIVTLTKLNVVTGMPAIKPTRLGDDAGLYGALAIAVETPRNLVEVQGPLIKRILEGTL
ncbi:MAG: ROK family protein [Desulfurococcaceae archaeon]